MLLTENPSQGKIQTLPQSKGLENNFQANGPMKETRISILIPNKINFQPKVIKKDKEGHFILIKGKIYQEELNSEYLRSKRKGTHIHKRNFAKAQSTHCTSHNNSGRLQHPTFIYEQIVETETKQGPSETNRSYETNGLNRYLQNILS